MTSCLTNLVAVNPQLVQLLYALAIFFSFPLSVYPCIRITESWIFGTRAGKQNFQVGLRTGLNGESP